MKCLLNRPKSVQLKVVPFVIRKGARNYAAIPCVLHDYWDMPLRRPLLPPPVVTNLNEIGARNEVVDTRAGVKMSCVSGGDNGRI